MSLVFGPKGPLYNMSELDQTTGPLPDTQIVGCACAGDAGNVFPGRLGTPTCITAHVDARAGMHGGIATSDFL